MGLQSQVASSWCLDARGEMLCNSQIVWVVLINVADTLFCCWLLSAYLCVYTYCVTDGLTDRWSFLVSKSSLSGHFWKGIRIIWIWRNCRFFWISITAFWKYRSCFIFILLKDGNSKISQVFMNQNFCSLAGSWCYIMREVALQLLVLGNHFYLNPQKF